MNSTLSRRASPSTAALCRFCRQSLQRQHALAAGRQWLKPPQAHGQRRLLQTQHASGGSSSASLPPAVLFGAPRGRRFMSASTGAGPAVVERVDAADRAAPAAAASTTTSAVPTSFKRYSLYPETVAPMTMRPPPPPSPVVVALEEEVAMPEPRRRVQTPSTTATTTPAQEVPTTEAKTTPPAAAAAAAAATPSSTSATTTPATPKKRPSRLRSPRKAAMRLTPAAVEHVRSLLEGPEPQLLKVGVRNRGCSGLAYNLEYVASPGPFDELVEQDGVRVLVDSKALFSIIGSEMDWVEDKLSQRFVFRNPNIKEECGCGESFMV